MKYLVECITPTGHVAYTVARNASAAKSLVELARVDYPDHTWIIRVIELAVYARGFRTIHTLH